MGSTTLTPEMPRRLRLPAGRRRRGASRTSKQAARPQRAGLSPGDVSCAGRPRRPCHGGRSPARARQRVQAGAADRRLRARSAARRPGDLRRRSAQGRSSRRADWPSNAKSSCGSTVDEARARRRRPGARAAARRAACRTTRSSTPRRVARSRGCALRVRRDGDAAMLTFKGPVAARPMKMREEHETAVGDGDVLMRVLEALGLHAWFRYQKYREEFTRAGRDRSRSTKRRSAPSSRSKASEAAHRRWRARSGARRADYILDSYRALFLGQRRRAAVHGADMVFAAA